MSEENVEIVRGILDAVQRGDWETAIGGYDPDVVLDQSRMLDGGVYHGHSGLREFYRRWFGSWEDLQIVPERVVDAGKCVVDINQASGRGRGSGAAVRMRTANIWTIECGKVVRQVGYPAAAEALQAAGLRK